MAKAKQSTAKMITEVESEPRKLVGYTPYFGGLPLVFNGETNFDFWLSPEKNNTDRYKVEITVTKL